MNFKNLILALSIFLILLITISNVMAVEDNNITETSPNLEINDKNLNENVLSANTEDTLSDSQTIDVDKEGDVHREMNDHTIRDAINSANAGDTIIINGAIYDHVHIVIDKPLTIKSNVGTKLMHCSNQGAADSGHQGIFYITSKASGTVIEGFNFLNDDGTLFDSEGYAVYINGASNVVIKNCNISNKDVGNGIIVKNAANTVIQNNNISNTQYGINIIDSTKTPGNPSNLEVIQKILAFL